MHSVHRTHTSHGEHTTDTYAMHTPHTPHDTHHTCTVYTGHTHTTRRTHNIHIRYAHTAHTKHTTHNIEHTHTTHETCTTHTHTHVQKASLGEEQEHAASNRLIPELERRAPLAAPTVESACSAGDLGSIPGPRRPPGEGNGRPLQYSCLENPMDRGAWRAIQPVGSLKRWRRLST